MEKLIRQKRILICDDSELLIAGLKFVVEKVPGVTVVGQAANGQQAIDMVRELTPDMVLMDVSMPGINGVEATRLIKEEFPGIRVLMLTSREDADTVRESLFAGADGFCVKSISSEQLIAAIESVSFGAVWLAPAICQQLKESLVSTKITQKHPAGQPRPDQLSAREKEVLALLVAGLSNAEIAERLILSLDTIKTHVRHIFEKLQVRHRTEAAVEAIRRGVVSAA